jgi:hypothetical protein
MRHDFSPELWNEIKDVVQSAIATAYPLDVAAEARRIALANGGENVALNDIAESLVQLSLPARVVLFFSERDREEPAGSGEMLSEEAATT